MPGSPEALALAERYRQQAEAIRAQLVRDFEQLWPGLDELSDPQVRAAWLSLVAALVQQWAPAAREAAMAYYRQAATLETGTPPPPGLLAAAAVAAPIAGLGLVIATLRRTAEAIFQGAPAGLSLAAADRVSLELAAEATARLALDAARAATQQAVLRDTAGALGWMRVTDGDPCAFCAMLASRGAVYKSAEAAGFEVDPIRGEINRFHNKCGCQVVPVFTREPVLPETTQRAQQLWEQSQREARESGELNRGTSNDALNALRRHMSRTGDQ